MVIPPRLYEKLQSNEELMGCVLLSIKAFEPWVTLSGMPFFPEYTDHGPNHIQHVLTTAESLISDQAFDVFTAADAAVLVLSILLHDSALHISEDSFIYIITNVKDQHINKSFSDKPWPESWLDFVAEASRFDGRKLFSLFGDTDPIRRPPMKSDLFTKRDRLLIGEYVRRHHSRLAHEIALYGVPNPTGDLLKLIEAPDYIADLSGVIARSHGTSIRNCISYLKQHYNEREYKGVHSTFLMGLVRISDYLHIESERAPNTILKVKQLQSPFSVREWEAHRSIIDVRHTHEDPEALYIRPYRI